MAADEITLLHSTIKVLRSQNAEFKARELKEKLRFDLAPLPVIKNMAVTGIDKTDTAVAKEAQKELFKTSLAEEDTGNVQCLQNDILSLSKRLNTLRSAPKIIDLAEGGQTWLTKQQESTVLKTEADAISRRVNSAISSNTAHLFRSLACVVPSKATPGGSKLVGKLTIPSTGGAPLASQKVSFQPQEFARLHRIFT